MLRFMLCAAVAVLVSSSGALQVYAQKIPDPTTGNSKFDAAVVAGVQFLKTDILKSKDGGPLSLEAYAIMKAGVSHSDPAVHKAVEEVRKKVQGSIYTPESQQEHVYEAGVDAMLLSDHDPDANRKELQAIAGYLMAQQGADGSWDYPQRRVGDTSMNQYGVLGLWACMRAGVKVPPTVWDRCLRWHIKGQSNDGGWAYHPGRQEGPGQGSSTHNMTFGATGTMDLPGTRSRRQEQEEGQEEAVWRPGREGCRPERGNQKPVRRLQARGQHQCSREQHQLRPELD